MEKIKSKIYKTESNYISSGSGSGYGYGDW